MLYEMLSGETPFSGDNPFVVMNNRLVNNPSPPRRVNPHITPEMQEIIYRSLEREPGDRYKSAEAFMWDLLHEDDVGSPERNGVVGWMKRKLPLARKTAFYAALALTPIVIFSLGLPLAALILYIVSKKEDYSVGGPAGLQYAANVQAPSGRTTHRIAFKTRARLRLHLADRVGRSASLALEQRFSGAIRGGKSRLAQAQVDAKRFADESTMRDRTEPTHRVYMRFALRDELAGFIS